MDYGKLNEAAQTLYDEAFARGKAAGRDDAAHESVEHVGRRMMELAAQVVEQAFAPAGEEQRVALVKIAKRMYGRAPGGPGFVIARKRAADVLDAFSRIPAGFTVERVEGRAAPGQDPGAEYTLIDCRRAGPNLVVAQVARRLIGVQKITWTMRQLADVETAEAFAALMALAVADAKRRQG
jgi:hypothetical protein